MRTGATPTCLRTRARGRIWLGSTRGWATITSPLCTDVRVTCSAQCRACMSLMHSSSFSRGGLVSARRRAARASRSSCSWRSRLFTSTITGCLDVVAGCTYCVVIVGVAHLIGTGPARRPLQVGPSNPPKSAGSREPHPSQDRSCMLSTWFGCGSRADCARTAGAICAILLHLASARGGRLATGAVALAVAFAGVWAASSVARELEADDPQVIVIDEVAGMLVTMLAVNQVSLKLRASASCSFAYSMLPSPGRSLFRALSFRMVIVLDADTAAGLGGGNYPCRARAVDFLHSPFTMQGGPPPLDVRGPRDSHFPVASNSVQWPVGQHRPNRLVLSRLCQESSCRAALSRHGSFYGIIRYSDGLQLLYGLPRACRGDRHGKGYAHRFV